MPNLNATLLLDEICELDGSVARLRQIVEDENVLLASKENRGLHGCFVFVFEYLIDEYPVFTFNCLVGYVKKLRNQDSAKTSFKPISS